MDLVYRSQSADPYPMATAYLPPPNYKPPLAFADLAAPTLSFPPTPKSALTLWAMPSMSCPLLEPPQSQVAILASVLDGWHAHVIHCSFSSRKANKRATKCGDSSCLKNTCSLWVAKLQLAQWIDMQDAQAGLLPEENAKASAGSLLLPQEQRGSMCPIKKETDISSREKDAPNPSGQCNLARPMWLYSCCLKQQFTSGLENGSNKK